MVHRVEIDFAGRPLSLETGRLAKLADAAVLCTYGETVVLVTVGVSAKPIDSDFLPLRVDFEEKMYAVGRIPGGFFKREGRPSEEATLSCRKIDRPIRPLLPQGLRNEVQIIAMPLSVENTDSVEVAALIGASAALHISSVPFEGPFGAVQVGFVDDELTLNPSFEQLAESSLKLMVVATRNGIVMVELEGDSVPEDTVADAIVMAEKECLPIVAAIEELAKKAAKPKGDYQIWQPRPEIRKYITANAAEKVAVAAEILDKTERNDAIAAITAELVTALEAEYPKPAADINAVIEDILKQQLRRLVLEERRRPDGRGLKELRPISCEVGLLPRAHGSGLFNRGETQVLTTTTLGATRDQRMVRTLEQEDYSRFMHHYNFPPFCVGEVRMLRGPGRREIGHGHLAQKAIEAALPDEEGFPYTIRLVSEVLESNGSSSMASVCASTLSLMDAGVPIKSPVAGISVGLVYEGPERYATLTDIQGLEDHAGHMDFKVAGTREGVNALHLDMKIQGLPSHILREALAQAREARMQILDIMQAAISEPRESLSEHAPRMMSVKIDKEKIGLLIGPGGKHIRSLQTAYEVEIDVEEDGTVLVFGKDSEKVNQCYSAISDMMREVGIGEVFTGKVVSIMPFGAFVEMLPGKEGLVHISQLAWEHVGKTEDVVKLGDEIQVKVMEVDDQGKVRLSHKEMLPRPEGMSASNDDSRSRRPHGRGGDGEDAGGHKPYTRDKRR